jgi:leucyl-tRNA synthetase
MRGTVEAKKDANEEDILKLIKKDKKLSNYIEGNKIRKNILVKNRLMNVII